MAVPAISFFKCALAFDQRQLLQVIAVEIEQVEGDQHDHVGPSLQFVLQHREIRGAIYGRHHDFAVDDGGAGADVPGVVGDLPDALGPVVAAPGEDLDRFIGEVHLDAIAVELDLVDPAIAAGYAADRGRQRRLDKSGERRALTPIAAGFFRGAMVYTRRSGSGS
jgi:hypothetical protein